MNASYVDVLKCSSGSKGVELQLDAEKETHSIAKPYPSFIPTIVFNKVRWQCCMIFVFLCFYLVGFFLINIFSTFSFIIFILSFDLYTYMIEIWSYKATAIIERVQKISVHRTENAVEFIRWVTKSLCIKLYTAIKGTSAKNQSSRVKNSLKMFRQFHIEYSERCAFCMLWI